MEKNEKRKADCCVYRFQVLCNRNWQGGTLFGLVPYRIHSNTLSSLKAVKKNLRPDLLLMTLPPSRMMTTRPNEPPQNKTKSPWTKSRLSWKWTRETCGVDRDYNHDSISKPLFSALLTSTKKEHNMTDEQNKGKLNSIEKWTKSCFRFFP